MMDTHAQVPAEFLSLLVCPVSRAALVREGEWLYSTDVGTRRRYPIRNGIPVMLVEESEQVEPGEFQRVMSRRGACGPEPAEPATGDEDGESQV